MELRLKSKKWINKLLSIPESGMGYQIIDITLKDNRVIRRVKVFNAEIVELPSGYEDVSEKDIAQIDSSN